MVWPCNSDPIADELTASAEQIGGDALLGVEEPVFRYHGPPRSAYLPIARKTIAAFNSGASPADLGISEDRAEQLARQAETIGKFLHLLQVEERGNLSTAGPSASSVVSVRDDRCGETGAIG